MSNDSASPDTTVAQDALSARFLGASTARKTTKTTTTTTSTKTIEQIIILYIQQVSRTTGGLVRLLYKLMVVLVEA